MPENKHARRLALSGLTALALLLAGPAGWAGEENAPLRVCADANNMPFSNADGEGFENALAELLAEEMGRELEYSWWPQRRGFIRNTLNAQRCDLVMGVPEGYGLTATTSPYYRSSYVAVSRRSDELDIRELQDPRLRELRIGVHTIGDDYSNPPPAQVLARLGVRDNVHGYSIYGDYSLPDPARALIDAVAAGEIDVAIAWGPTAGWFARQQETALRLTPLSAEHAMLPMAFDIALGLRRGEEDFRGALERALRKRQADVKELLARFGVPVLPSGRKEPGRGEQAPREAAR